MQRQKTGKHRAVAPAHAEHENGVLEESVGERALVHAISEHSKIPAPARRSSREQLLYIIIAALLGGGGVDLIGRYVDAPRNIAALQTVDAARAEELKEIREEMKTLSGEVASVRKETTAAFKELKDEIKELRNELPRSTPPSSKKER
jgi:hypothetical protein